MQRRTTLSGEKKVVRNVDKSLCPININVIKVTLKYLRVIFVPKQQPALCVLDQK